MQLPAKKSLGQNFLIDPSVHQRIVKAIGPKPGDTLIEIGPGTGLLTTHLLKSPLERLIAYELDDRAVPLLQEEFASEGARFTVHLKDILEVDLAEFGTNQLRVVGNIPYYITSPILFKLIDDRAFVKDAHLLVQLEVAERLTASTRTKAYGIPTVIANFFGRVEFLFEVKRGSFRPAPNVDSALVRIDFQQDYFTRTATTPPPGFDPPQFQSFVRGLFRMRRKTIRNNLKGLVTVEAIQSLEGDHILERRAEELEVAEVLDLFTRSR